MGGRVNKEHSMIPEALSGALRGIGLVGAGLVLLAFAMMISPRSMWNNGYFRVLLIFGALLGALVSMDALGATGLSLCR